MIPRSLLSSLVVCLALSSACSPSPKLCTPGKAELCACAGGQLGAQVCSADGSELGACDCSAASGAGGAVKCSDAAAPACGTHGVCVNTTSGAACACGTGYQGLICNQCETGYQDHDNDGTCLPSCAGLALNCSGHGACGDATGTAVCDCAAGYTGPSCAACATGYQDHDGNGTCSPTCTASTCTGHGTCSDATGEALCTCATGYAGTTCAACAGAYQDNGGTGVCQLACAPSTCSGHGACSDLTGTAQCSCATGYAGPACAGCASGYQDNDGNGVCAPTCATASLVCGGRASCQDRSGVAACACSPGYVAGVPLPGGGLNCEWSGVVRDPGLQGVPANMWAAGGSMLLIPSDPGNLEPGVARAPNPTSQGTTVQQTGIDMPPLGGADTFGVKMSVRFEGSAFVPFPPAGMVRLGSSVAAWYSNTGWSTSTLCLGEGAFGPGLTLTSVSLGGFMSSAHAIDHLEVVPAACPSPGAVLNGAFESSAPTGWSLNGNGAVVSAGPVNGSRNLRLANTTICDTPGRADTTLSVPLATSLPNAALRFSTVGTAGAALLVETGNTVLRKFVTNGTLQTVTVCLGDWARGSVVPVSFTLPSSTAFGSCSTPDVRQVDIDDMALVSDASCALPLNPYNGGFETFDLGTQWFSPADYYGGTVVFDSTAASAHSGSGSLVLQSNNVCGSAEVTQVVSLPGPAGGAGGAVHFWYQVSAAATFTAKAELATALAYPAPSFGSLPLTATTGWTHGVLCVNSAFSGLPAVLHFSAVDARYGSCGTNPAPDGVRIDDVTVGTDPSCPL